MNAEAKFVSSVMDARLKKAKRERNAYKNNVMSSSMICQK